MARMIGKPRDIQVCCKACDPMLRGSSDRRRKQVRINRRREKRAWLKEQ
ncbi:hypothetical protein ABT352_22725 [Streptosporangium sp. NPDC000563]